MSKQNVGGPLNPTQFVRNIKTTTKDGGKTNQKVKNNLTFKGREYKRIYGSVNYEITRNSSL